MMETPTPPASPMPTSKGSSVLYALGKLTAEVEHTRQAVDRTPALVAEAMSPLVARVTALEPRVTALERHRWRSAGGMTVIVFLLSTATLLISGTVHLPRV